MVEPLRDTAYFRRVFLDGWRSNLKAERLWCRNRRRLLTSPEWDGQAQSWPVAGTPQ